MTKQMPLTETHNEVRVPIESNKHIEALFTKAVGMVVFENLQKLAEKYPLPGVRLALNEVAAITEIHSSDVERRNLRLIAKAGHDINQYEATRLVGVSKGVGFELVLRRIHGPTDDEMTETASR